MRHDFLYIISLQGLDILLRQDLEQVLIAEAPGRVAGAGFRLTQNGKAYPRRLQNRDQRFGHLNVAVHQRPGATHPEDIFRLGVVLNGRNVQAFGPPRTCLLRATPGMPTLLETAQLRFSGFRHAPLFKYQVTTHIDNRIHVFDVDRTILLAGAAGRTGPQHILANHIADHRHAIVRRLRSGRHRLCRLGHVPL